MKPSLQVDRCTLRIRSDISPVELTACRTGNFTRLTHTLAICVAINAAQAVHTTECCRAPTSWTKDQNVLHIQKVVHTSYIFVAGWVERATYLWYVDTVAGNPDGHACYETLVRDPTREGRHPACIGPAAEAVTSRWRYSSNPSTKSARFKDLLHESTTQRWLTVLR